VLPAPRKTGCPARGGLPLESLEEQTGGDLAAPGDVFHCSSTRWALQFEGRRAPCADHGGVESATAEVRGANVDVVLVCNDGKKRGPYQYEVREPYPCADHKGVYGATARPGAGVVEVIVYCNDGTSEGPYVFELR
jgi:hypothetical protein